MIPIGKKFYCVSDQASEIEIISLVENRKNDKNLKE